MLITCPNCEAGYQVPDHLLQGDGRRLRCKSCMEEWHVKLPPTEAGALETATPDAKAPPPPMDEPGPASALPARRGRRLPWLAPAAAWAASVIILSTGGAATLHWRAKISIAWPASERVLGHQSHQAGATLPD